MHQTENQIGSLVAKAMEFEHDADGALWERVTRSRMLAAVVVVRSWGRMWSRDRGVLGLDGEGSLGSDAS